MRDLLDKLERVRKSGDGWTARCPSHDDGENSLSIHRGTDRWLLKCHAGCPWEDVVASVGLKPADLFDEPSGESREVPPSNNRATVQPAGLTLEQYASAKQLPIAFLKSCGLSEINYDGMLAVRIPYIGSAGETLAVRFRIAMEGDRFRWKSGTKPHLYGLNRIDEVRAAGHVVLVEGESDCHTFWFHGIPALGVPGAATWREDRDAPCLDGVETIYVIIEPDRGGDAVRKWLACSKIRSRARLISLALKDPSSLHIAAPAEFRSRWQVACLGALPWAAAQADAEVERRENAWAQCSQLAQLPSILDEFDRDLSRVGVVGERLGARLIYLALVSRLLKRPVSIAVKGPSSGGKSFLVESTLRFFPQAAYYPLTAMSERALAYSTEPLQHRFLVIYEAAGIASEMGTYLIRSLLSEGHLRYETIEKTKDGLVPRLIEREGPTGLIVTTTSQRLHPENETRILSLTVTDTREQTAAVFMALAREAPNAMDLTRWHALQVWLERGAGDVAIPYADKLARLVPPLAVRMRRDFKTVLTLIKAHALLQQATRACDEQGRIIATVEDYTAVRELVATLVAVGADATVRPEVRELVETVARLLSEGRSEITQAELRPALRLDKSAISRRVASAVDAGVLRNLEDRKGRPARLVLGDPLPTAIEILPSPERLHGCEVALGVAHPSPPSPSDVLHGCPVVEGYISPPSSHAGQHCAEQQRASNQFVMTQPLNLGPYCCAICGMGDSRDDPLLPVGIEPNHSWQHMACWQSSRQPTQC